jgi:peptidase YpeB-like protein
MRTIVAAVLLAWMTVPALPQTQPTHSSAYPTFPTLSSAWATAPLSPCNGRGDRDRPSSFNPTSPCYTGTPYPNYSAVEPFEFPNQKTHPALPGSASLDEDQAKLRIEAKGYLNISKLEKDKRGIWRGNATMKDGRSVEVTLDLEGNIYSEPSTLYIRIEPAPRVKESR